MEINKLSSNPLVKAKLPSYIYAHAMLRKASRHIMLLLLGFPDMFWFFLDLQVDS